MFAPAFPHHSWSYFPMVLTLCVLISVVVVLLAIVGGHSIQLSYPLSNTSIFIASQSQDTHCVLHWDGFLKRFVCLKAGCSLRLTTLTNQPSNPCHSCHLVCIMSSTALFLSDITYQFVSLFNIHVFLLSFHPWELGLFLLVWGCLSESRCSGNACWMDEWPCFCFFPDKGHEKQNFQPLMVWNMY